MLTSRTYFTGLIIAWLLASSLGFLVLGAYHASPSSPGTPPDRWPSDTSIPLDGSLPTVLMFIHPRCPCSSASLAELQHLLARCRGRFAGHVITFRPEKVAKGWDGPDPGGLSRRVDPGGREAARFGVETSGHVLLFDPSGRRYYSGGITVSRGHRGDNPGLDRLVATILGGPAGTCSSPVFGCPVLAPAQGRSGSIVP